MGTAAVIIGSTLVGGALQSQTIRESTEKATKAQTESTEAGIEEARRQFDAAQELLAPFVQAGETSLTSMMALSGQAGEEAQAEQIRMIQESPGFAETVQAGEEAILASGSATGGLRGGNIQGALAQYRPQMLQQAIADRYNQLGALTQMGQASAAGQASAGIQTGQNVTGLLQNLGNVQGQQAMASGLSQANMWGTIAGLPGTLAGMSGSGDSLLDTLF